MFTAKKIMGFTLLLSFYLSNGFGQASGSASKPRQKEYVDTSKVTLFTEKDTTENKKGVKTTEEGFRESIGLSPALFKKVLNQQFADLATGSSNTVLGNSASIDLANPEISFSGSLISKNGSLLTIKATGEATDGVYALFNNSKLNSKVSLDIQYNFLNLSKQFLVYDLDSAVAFSNKLKKINYKFRYAKLAAKSRLDSIKLVSGVLLMQKKAKIDSATLTGITESLTKLGSKTDQDRVMLNDYLIKKDSLVFVLKEDSVKLDSIKTDLAHLEPVDTRIRRASNERATASKKLSFQSSITGFSFGWWTLGYKIKNNAFKQLNEDAAFDNQVTKTNFISHELKGQYSHYTYSRKRFTSYFWDLGAAVSIKDNFDDLIKKEVEESGTYASGNNQRKASTTFDAYTGAYLRNLNQLRIFGDYYSFLFKNNMAAVHLAAEWIKKEYARPTENATIGFLISFKDSKDQSTVNAELFYTFSDVFHTTDLTYKFLQRNEIGIRFLLPIKFKSNQL